MFLRPFGTRICFKEPGSVVEFPVSPSNMSLPTSIHCQIDCLQQNITIPQFHFVVSWCEIPHCVVVTIARCSGGNVERFFHHGIVVTIDQLDSGRAAIDGITHHRKNGIACMKRGYRRTKLTVGNRKLYGLVALVLFCCR